MVWYGIVLYYTISYPLCRYIARSSTNLSWSLSILAHLSQILFVYFVGVHYFILYPGLFPFVFALGSLTVRLMLTHVNNAFTSMDVNILMIIICYQK